MSENKLFKANRDKKHFTVTIVAMENSNRFSVANEPGYEAKYDEVIGLIEVVKHNLIRAQTEKNRKELKKRKNQQP